MDGSKEWGEVESSLDQPVKSIEVSRHDLPRVATMGLPPGVSQSPESFVVVEGDRLIVNIDGRQLQLDSDFVGFLPEGTYGLQYPDDGATKVRLSRNIEEYEAWHGND